MSLFSSSREVVDYDFSVIDESRFSLLLRVPIKNRFMQQAFIRAKRMALKQTGKTSSRDLGSLDSFEVPKKVFPMLLLGTRSVRDRAYSEVVSDGNSSFRVVSEVLLRGVYSKVRGVWVCELFFDGSYID